MVQHCCLKILIRADGSPYEFPVLANLFGTPERVLGMGADSVEKLREIGQTLAYLKEPEPPKGIKDAAEALPLLKDIWSMAPHVVKNAPCQTIIWEGDAVDLTRLPIQHCWFEDVAPLITWGLTVTRGPHKKRQNLGIYRQQLLGKNGAGLCAGWRTVGVHWIFRRIRNCIPIHRILWQWYWVATLLRF